VHRRRAQPVPARPWHAGAAQAIAHHQARFWGLDHDPDTEVFVTTGATEALAGALLGLLDTGDEVVLFEPMYDSYQACIALAGRRGPTGAAAPPDGEYAFDPRRAPRR
jgi:N-succinyldiaminopimelate aminotransferase